MTHVTEELVRELILEVYPEKTIDSLIEHTDDVGAHWWEAALLPDGQIRVSSVAIGPDDERPMVIPKIVLDSP